MSNRGKQARRVMFLAFALTMGWVACDSVTAPQQSAAEAFSVTNEQALDDDIARREAERAQAPILKPQEF